MAARLRNSDWQEDENLRDDLVKYVRQNLRRKVILDLVQIKYPSSNQVSYGALVLSLVDSNILASSLRIIAWILTMYAKLFRKR